MKNILLSSFDTPFGSIPFPSIRNEDFKPAIQTLIAKAKEEIQALVDSKEKPTFENTLEAMETIGRDLNVASSVFFNLHSAETNEELDALAQEISPMLSAYSNDIALNFDLFLKIKEVYENKDAQTYTPEQERLLDKMYKSFTRNGALLNDADKQRLRDIDAELAKLKVSFSQHVLQETNAYFLHLTNPEDLAGLPDSIVEVAKAEAKSRELEGWVFTLQYPSLVPFLKYAENRELRKEMHLANSRKAFQDNAQNNEANIKEIVRLRNERAALLGFSNHAEFVLAERMAGTPAAVTKFLEDLLEKARPFAEKEIETLRALAKTEGVEELLPYDHSFFAEKVRKQQFAIDEEALKPYFELNHVLEAAFTAAEKLFGLEFELNKDIPVYHPEVSVYQVKENGKHKGLLYTDWHPRKGKRAGAWMTSYKGQFKQDGWDHRPHISIVCNFSRPTETTPSLLTFNEVTTLFHEFGHALHGLLADTVYESLSGTSVYWDFVELPSQFMENYCYQKEFLSSFARHYETGEPLPDSEIDKIVASSNFMEGYQTLRQISFGLLDMAYHTGQFKENDEVESFEQRVTSGCQLYPHLDKTALSPSFSHIFAGGYSAGYYSYKWAEVLDADAFSYFKESGIFNPQIAQKLKTLLSKGGTVDPMKLYEEFRGRKPSPEALLERAGLK